jgi:hypothetical protein
MNKFKSNMMAVVQSVVGDRFKWKHGYLELEVHSITPNETKIRCVKWEENQGWKPNEIQGNHTSEWHIDNWEYLGNFGKSNQFKTIYDILNGND